MNIPDLVHAIVNGDLLAARQWVTDAHRAGVQWERLEQPAGLSEGEMAIAAALVELLSSRTGAAAPPWTGLIGAVEHAIVLDPGLEQMPRSFARAKRDAPEPLRRRNLWALPDFLDVA